MQTRHIIRNLFKYRGAKTLTRVLLNTRVETLGFDEVVLDLGSGKREPHFTYYDHFQNIDKEKLITINITAEVKPDIVADLEIGLPIKDNSVSNVLMFNLLEHIYHYQKVCTEVHRILKQGGKCYTFVPFLFQIHEDPCDYFRYSEYALSRVFREAGFTEVTIENLGFGLFTTFWFFFPLSFLQKPSFLRLPGLLLFPMCLAIDDFIERHFAKKRKKRYSSHYPLAYFITSVKT